MKYSINIRYAHPDARILPDGSVHPEKCSRWCEYIVHTADLDYLKFLVKCMITGVGPYPEKLEGWAILEHEVKRV